MARYVRGKIKKRQSAPFDWQDAAEQFEALCALSDGWLDKLMNRLFLVVKRSVSFKIIQAGSGARPDACDEAIYESYTRLMNSYAEASEVYRMRLNGILRGEIAGILEGINAILSSRVREKAENEHGGGENPIRLEKKAIMSKWIQVFAGNVDALHGELAEAESVNIKERFLSENVAGFTRQAGLDALDALGAAIRDVCAGRYFEYYEEAARGCLSELNDVEGRAALSYYYELSVREGEILRAIINIQIGGLERAVEMSGLSEAEREAVNAFLSVIRGAYQVFGKRMEDTERSLREERGAPRPPADSFAQFAEDLKSQTWARLIFPSPAYERYRREHERLFGGFERLISRGVAERLEQATGKAFVQKLSYQMHRAVTENVMMADDMRAAFEAVVRWRAEAGEKAAVCAQAEVVEGVCETMAIKAESIEENKASFAEECRAFIAITDDERPEITPEQKAEAADEAFTLMLGLLCRIRAEKGAVSAEDAAEAFEGCLECGAASAVLDVFRKEEDSRRESVNRKALAFKRDVLLYEVGTFEEIMNYSVPILRGQADETPRGLAAVMDGVNETVGGILNKNGIFYITPVPHEPFNAREQEVILAEKNDLFQKGEIIKVVNSGFRQDGAVIIRANVIAAK